MKAVIFAAAAAAVLWSAAPIARADVGEEEYVAPPRQHVYTEREYVEPAPYREEVRVYRTVPTYVYREVPVYREVYREVPVYREHVHYFPPAPHRVIGRVLFGY